MKMNWIIYTTDRLSKAGVNLTNWTIGTWKETGTVQISALIVHGQKILDDLRMFDSIRTMVFPSKVLIPSARNRLSQSFIEAECFAFFKAENIINK
jgi:hypothetical protein